MTNLLGRRVRGTYRGRNPVKEANDHWIQLPCEGQVVAVTESDGLYLYILDAEHQLRQVYFKNAIVIPRDAETPLRDQIEAAS